jgi:DNA-binding NarL/FixJ family response regulator
MGHRQLPVHSLPSRADPPSSALAALSGRELEVLRLASNGSTNIEIGERLSLSVHAIKFHLASIYRKLGVANRTEAAVVFVAASGPPAVTVERRAT